MAGQIKKMLDQIISKRSNGNALVISTTKTKLVLKGLNPDQLLRIRKIMPTLSKKCGKSRRKWASHYKLFEFY